MSRAPFAGPGGRLAYLAASLAVFFVQHLLVLLGLGLHGDVWPTLPLWFWPNPFRLLVSQAGTWTAGAELPLLLGMAGALATDAALTGLAFRRARLVDVGAWAAALVMIPFVQFGAVAWLALAPDRVGEPEHRTERGSRAGARTAASGVLLGVAATVGAVALSTLAVGTYGFGLFIASPALIATIVGYMANRDGEIGFKRTFGLVALAFLLGGAALIAFAFEGAVCLLLAAPLAAIVGLVGGAVGLGLARLGRRGRGTTLAGVAALPLVIAAEALLPPHAAFESLESVEVEAPPAAVWAAVTRMGPIPEPPAAPFRWGLAYPVAGEIMGTGVGAVRRGIFSTGIAYERVTEWVPNERLSFDVLSDPPTMRELSPYAGINAPHDIGYFRTLDARFTLTPLGPRRTRLSLATRHELDLEPALYWTSIARWAVHANKLRVLEHFRRQAEAGASPPRE